VPNQVKCRKEFTHGPSSSSSLVKIAEESSLADEDAAEAAGAPWWTGCDLKIHIHTKK
jgi:hypothetical protein